jgi:hypothetical protein
LYQNEIGSVKVTPSRVVFGGTTYAVANITSVKAVTDSNLRMIGVLVAVVGILLMVTANVAAMVVGVVAVLVGVLAAVFGVQTQVIVTTGAAEKVGLSTRDPKLALEVASAVNLAIMKRSLR